MTTLAAEQAQPISQSRESFQIAIKEIAKLDKQLSNLGIGGNSLLFTPLNAYCLGTAYHAFQPVREELTAFIDAKAAKALGMAEQLGETCLACAEKFDQLLQAGRNNLNGQGTWYGYERGPGNSGFDRLWLASEKLKEFGRTLKSLDETLTVSVSDWKQLKDSAYQLSQQNAGLLRLYTSAKDTYRGNTSMGIGQSLQLPLFEELCFQ